MTTITSRLTKQVGSRLPETANRDLRYHVNAVRTGLWTRNPWNDVPATPQLERPILLVGCPRSGTSITADIFGTHPQVAHWSEALRVWDPAGYDDPQADHCWETDDVDRAEVDRVHAMFEVYRHRKGRARFVNKHPRNTVRLEWLRAAFPDAYVIHVVRDGRAVVNSIVRRSRLDGHRQDVPFGDFCKPPNWREHLRDNPFEQAALQWREIVSYALQRRHLFGDRYLEITYEDICADPHAAFERMFVFAGLRHDAAALAGVPTEMRNKNAAHDHEVSPTDRALVLDVQRDLLTALGYPV